MIAAEGLTKRFGGTIAVDDASFEVQPGSLVALVGHDGAGKSTTLRMLVGLVTPTAGGATILGKPYAELERPLERVGVLVGHGINPSKRVRDHLRICAATAGLDERRIDGVLDTVGLTGDDERRGRDLLADMRARLGIAVALLADPEVLILDEPGESLDAAGQRWLSSLLRHLADDGRTVLVSCREADEVAQAADRVLVMDRGSLLAESAPGELTEPHVEVLVRSPGAEVLADELRSAGIQHAEVSGDEVRVRDAPVPVVSKIASESGVPVWEIREDEPSLEEAVDDLTKEHAANGRPPDGAAQDPSNAKNAEPDGAQQEPGEATDAEARLDRELAELPDLGRSNVVAVLAPANGLGRTTLSFLVADVLAATTADSAIAIALSSDHDRMSMPVAEDGRTSLHLGDLLGDLPGFGESAHISPYVSVAASGAHVISGPPERDALDAIEPEQLDALLDFVARFYELIVLDVGELASAALRAVVRRADQVLLLGAPGAVDDLDEQSEVLDAIEAERSAPAILVFNQVDEQRLRSYAHSAGAGAGAHVLVPQDRELIRALDAGDFELAEVAPVTRYALKRLGLAVAEGLR